MKKVLGFWKENYQDRLMLLGIIVAVFILIKSLEELIPKEFIEAMPFDVPLALLGIIIILMIIHSFFLFVAQFQRRRNPRPLNPDYSPSLDIFVCGHNEERVFKDTIIHLLEQDYPNFRVYAINDRSKDGTLEQLLEAEKIANEKHPGKLTIIDRPKDAFPGKAAGLNDAMKISEGEVVCVFDADARIDQGFLRSMVRYLENPLVGGVQAQKVISNPEQNFLTKCQFHEYAMDTYFQMGRDSIRGAVELRGNGQIVKRIALEQIGGWNEETLTDDLDLSTCLHVNGWDIRFSPDDKVYEEGVPTTKGLIKQRRRWAEGSIRRYLNYFFQITTPGRLTAHQAFDAIIFMTEFGVPLWIAFDIVYEIIRYINGRETYLTFLMIVFIGVGLTIFVNQFMGLRIYKKQSFFEALYNTVITNIYLMTLWNNVIMLTYRKILFSRSMGKWVVTEHGV